jgi:hypothetical protein
MKSMQAGTHQFDQELLDRIKRSHEARREFLARHARVDPAVWRDTNWRTSVVEVLSDRGTSGRRPPLRPLIAASLACERFIALRLVLATVVLMIWAMPPRVASAIAKRVLELKYL